MANLDAGVKGSTTPASVFTPSGPPLATGKPKYLDGVYSPSQVPFFTNYWNQVKPENAGKWGCVEGTRAVYNWTELDAAYALPTANGYPFRFYPLIWQPAAAVAGG